MKKLNLLTALVGLALAANAAQGATLSTTTAGPPNDGVLQNFTSIDWHANGAAFIQGFDLTSANGIGNTDTFTLTYQAFATAIGTTTPTPNLRVGSPGPAVGNYELTTVATLNELATCVNAGCSIIQLTLLAGSTWTAYFDITPDANQATGGGFTDGVAILSGDWTSELSTFTATGPIGAPGSSGVGSATLIGTVTTTNNAYVNPDLTGSRFDSTLNFPGQAAPDFTRPTFVNGVATGANTGTNFVVQADGSQQFTTPEPATLGLLAAGLFGLGAFGRRRGKQA